MQQKELDTETILEIASELFVKRGYASTSMVQIGDACGIQDGIYLHYESKEKLLLQILERLHRALRSQVFSIADDRAQTQLQRLQAINGFLKDYFLTKKACLVAVMGMNSEMICEDSRKIMQQIFLDWKETYIKLFSSHYSRNMAEVYATNSIVFIEGAIVWMRVTQECDPLMQVFTDMEKHLPPD